MSEHLEVHFEVDHASIRQLFDGPIFRLYGELCEELYRLRDQPTHEEVSAASDGELALRVNVSASMLRDMLVEALNDLDLESETHESA